MITRGATDLKTRRKKKETTLRDAIMNSLIKKFECEGIEATKKWLDICCANFSGEYDWPFIYKEAYNFILESKRLLDEKESQRQLDTAMINRLSIGGNIGQQNLFLSSTPQASYYSKKSNI